MWQGATVEGACGCGNVWQAVNLCQSPKRSYAQATTSLRLVPWHNKRGREGKRVGCGLAGSRHSLDPDLEPDSLASAAILIAIIKLQVSRIDSGLACGEAHSRHTGATLGALWRHTRGHPAALGQFGVQPAPSTLLSALCCIASIMCANK